MMTERGRYWQRPLDRWERSGLSQAAFCRRHGLKAVTFGWWKRKLATAWSFGCRLTSTPDRVSQLITAYKPMQPIDKGLPGPGLLGHVITSTTCDHLPLYRMERILRRHGVDLSRSTMCGWMALRRYGDDGA